MMTNSEASNASYGITSMSGATEVETHGAGTLTGAI